MGTTEKTGSAVERVRKAIVPGPSIVPMGNNPRVITIQLKPKKDSKSEVQITVSNG